MSIAQDLNRLEEIVRRLEAEEVDLDAALALFEEGVTRLRAARERLASAEVKVQTVLQEALMALFDAFGLDPTERAS